jgi:transposase
VHDWLKRKVIANESDKYESRLAIYSAIADFNSIKIYRTQFQNGGNGKFRVPMDEFDIFWGMLKSRLVKFRGLNGSTLYLHVKETEFRYNYRNEDLFELLVNIIHKRPLHLSKQ